MIKFTPHTLIHGHCSNTINISTVVMLGVWWCQFYTGSLFWGLCLLSSTGFLFGCSNVAYVFKMGLVRFDVGASTAVDCANVRSVH